MTTVEGSRPYRQVPLTARQQAFLDMLKDTRARNPDSLPVVKPISPREQEVLKLATEECLSNQGIADRLGISKKTVEAHKANLSPKLKPSSNEEGLSHQLGLITAQNVRENPAAVKNLPPVSLHITSREKEVLALVQDGWTNSEIKNALVISQKTVETHIRHLFGKFGVKGRKQLIRTSIAWEMQSSAI